MPLIAVNSELNSVYGRVQGNWEVIAHKLGENVDDFTIMKTSTHIVVIGRQAQSDTISLAQHGIHRRSQRR